MNYTDKTYFQSNPTWHAEDSSWRAAQVMRMLKRHPLPIQCVAEIGCGAGGILLKLREKLPATVELHGFDIALEAITLAKNGECERLHFHHEDLLRSNSSFDLLLIMDVVEHVSDCLGFLERCSRLARFKLYHIPLDIHVSAVLRASLLHERHTVGHIHYFTGESALASLVDTGHKVIDSFYTNGAVALAALHPSWKRRLGNIPRRFISLFSTAWAARLVGGYSLMVLTE